MTSGRRDFLTLMTSAWWGVAGCAAEPTAPATGPTSVELTPAEPAPSPAQPSPASPSEPIPIGVYLPMTGPLAEMGRACEQGIQLAARERSDARGVSGRPVSIKVIDSEADPKKATAAVTKLIDEHQVVALIGDVTSAASLSGGHVAQRRGVPMVTPTATHADVTKVGDFVFRACFIDAVQGRILAKFARDNLKVGRVALLVDGGAEYAVTISSAFETAFRALGGQIAATARYGPADVDFTAQMTEIRKGRPDALVVPGYYPDVAKIARAAARFQLGVPLLGGDGWESPELVGQAGAAIDGSYYVSHFAPEGAPPDFVTRFEAANGEPPSSLAALGFDTANLVLGAIDAATEVAPAAIREALARTSNFSGVAGAIVFDAHRNPIKPGFVMKIESGTPRLVTMLSA